MRLSQERCDFSLQVDDGTIFVHKSLLAVASPYFAATFRNAMKEKAQGAVNLAELDACSVKAVIQYIYSGSIQITEGNVLPLLSAADLLQIDWVKVQCCQLLKRVLKPENCFSLQRYADMHSCDDLYAHCHKYILENFPQLTNTEEWLLLTLCGLWSNETFLIRLFTMIFSSDPCNEI